MTLSSIWFPVLENTIKFSKVIPPFCTHDSSVMKVTDIPYRCQYLVLKILILAIFVI